MAKLPPELWIIIFDLVIEDGIIRLDQCDYNTFPYDHNFLSLKKDCYPFYGSYCRLRLVCRNFNALLGVRPECDLEASSFPFPMGIRALCIEGRGYEPVFRQLLGDKFRCERLVLLKISCGVSASPFQPNLSDFLRAGEGGAFPNVRRLSLWLVTTHYGDRETLFWTRLHRGFAQVVTLSVEVCSGWLRLDHEGDKVPTFQRLEILSLGSGITWWGCRFPHLRLASVNTLPIALETFGCQSHLECLLIRSHHAKFSVDVTSFSRLRVLSLPEDRLQELVPLGCDHPVEHLWIYLANISKNPTLIDEIVKRIPRIVRITLDISSVTEDRRRQRIPEFKRMRLDWFGLDLKPIKRDDHFLVIE